MFKKTINKKWILFFLCSVFLLSAAVPITAKETKKIKYSSKEFLNITRRARPTKTWAVLTGTVVNKRRGSKINRANIKVGMRFTNTRILAKIIVSEGKHGPVESYTVGQPYSGGQASIIASNNKQDDLSLLGNFGLRPEDLTMTFLFWDLKKELEKESVKGFDCRVFELASPKTNEMIKVYISSEYFYPIKVEWFKAKGKIPYRNVVLSSFETKGKLGSPGELNLYGPGWRTKVDFSKIRLGYTKDGIPKDIFTKDL